MKINTINYFIVDALKSIKRNRTISFAAMLTVLITFFIFGTFTLLALNFNKSIEDIASQVEIRVYLNDDIKMVDQREIEVKLNEQTGVKNVTYESKDEAFLNLQESLAENKGILEGYDLTNNPLPSSFIVTLEDPSYADAVSNAVEKMSGVESIRNQKEQIEKISSFVKVVQVVGIGLFVIFIGVSVFLIMNTIKLTVYSRRREVGIMKFVGATDWFIRWPFVIEGIIIGSIGAGLSSVLLYFAYNGVFNWILSSMFLINLVTPAFVLTTMLGGFILGGVIVGAIGSIAALRKFLIV
ncbi:MULTISPECIES: permease-like cell division protein FtsX [Clostridium]|jgi:cell division transport system permease protein|uniref:Cell division protein FtsX n=1 Tax=Clostridium disporicum TaxID=84024 RepID=A0A174JYR8_9CLOT|nr:MULTISPECIES: permease-like cell division protein FtsX [Clostridium]MCD2502981.1 permease-like cell division protein FtsX [Clostridium sp. NSJ-145]CUP02748.1 cell-division protein [Clostridium disporicum]